MTRTFLLYVPSGYDGRRRVPLVLNFHGSTSSPEEQEDTTRIEAVADRHGFAVAAPRAAIDPGVWNVPGVPLPGTTVPPQGLPDDVRFTADVIDAVGETICVDDRRVYSTGASGGARFSSSLGCLLADRIAAIGPVAGVRFEDGCNPGRPVPVIAFHGTADVVNPYAGGGPAYWGYGVEEAVRRWSAYDGCTGDPEVSQLSPSVTSTTHGGCDGGAEVVLVTVAGGGHNWPGGVDVTIARPELKPVIGVTTQEIDAGEEMWRFFARHGL